MIRQRTPRRGGGSTYEVVQNLVADNARHLKALLACDRVDDHVAMNANEVFRVQDAILILVHSIRVSRVLVNSLSRSILMCNNALSIGREDEV